ncbi:MAG TPA: hypothetical protein ENJ95_13440 [Bacteroidetes bacterium]|nr:hypothetical protein [Bacteroidota bacterium]
MFTACQKNELADPAGEEAVQEGALLLEAGAEPMMGGGQQDCDCLYEILDVTVDNPPTGGAGDHVELHFFADALCSPSLNIPYFSAYFYDADVQCGGVGLDDETEKFNTIGGYHQFNCDIPRYDAFDLKLDQNWWWLANCNPNFSQITGSITYRIKCREYVSVAPKACRPVIENGYVVSNTMTSSFTGQFGGNSQFDNSPNVKMGLYVLTLGGKLRNGCGCEPYIFEN